MTAGHPEVLPWPAGSTVPRWAQNRHGNPRRPRRYRIIEDTSTSHRYHIALYNDGLRQHRVIVTEPSEHTAIPAGRRRAGELVEIYTDWRPFGTRVFKATVQSHLSFDDFIEIRPD